MTDINDLGFCPRRKNVIYEDHGLEAAPRRRSFTAEFKAKTAERYPGADRPWTRLPGPWSGRDRGLRGRREAAAAPLLRPIALPAWPYRSSGRSLNHLCGVRGRIARKSRRSSVSTASVRYPAASATLTASARSRSRSAYCYRTRRAVSRISGPVAGIWKRSSRAWPRMKSMIEVRARDPKRALAR